MISSNDSANSKTVSTVETNSPVSEPGQVVLQKNRKGGRPKKADIQAKLKPGKVGRPAGDYQKARELCARMLVSEGDRMLRTLIEMALTDGHPNQMAALKMCLDRSLPISYFESKGEAGQNAGGIVINISGMTQVQSSSDAEDSVIDVEVSDGSR
jgi:hypothetical protein